MMDIFPANRETSMSLSPLRPWILAGVVCLSPVAFARADDAVKPAAPKSAEEPAAFEVEAHKDIAYRNGDDADPTRHKLDLYVPKGAKDFPVLFFVHGGSWRSGKKEIYSPLGDMFAKKGVGVVIINYRLTHNDKDRKPVRHPDHIEDVAKAFAWAHANVAKYGGRPDRIIVSGHSAGGHLVSLLATDEKYLKAEKLAVDNLRGVIAMSGVYSIVPTLRVFQAAFGGDETVCKAASPLTHVHPKLPPFLLLYAETELPDLDTMAEDFFAALKKNNCEATIRKIDDCSHITIMVNLIKETDPGRKLIEEFVFKYGEPKPPPKK
jgi:acetyl esterase/lipase